MILMAFDYNHSYSPVEIPSSDSSDCIKWSQSIKIPTSFEIIISRQTSLKALFQSLPDMLVFFHRGESIVTNRLTELFDEIVHLFYETDDKFTISLITQLFLSKNHALLSLILNPSTIDVFSMIIESNDFYKIGVTTQILISAFEKWPYDLICTLYKSNIFFSAILKSIDKVSIYLFADLLICKSNDFSLSFIWGFFLSLIRKKYSDKPPTYWDASLKPILNCSEIVISHYQRIMVIRILNSFLLHFQNEIQFRQIIIECLPLLYDDAVDDDELVELLNISFIVPYHKKIIQIALNLARKGKMDTMVTEKAILLLSIHAKNIPISEIINILYLLLQESHPNNFVFRSAVNLIQETIEKHPQSSLFILAMQQIIAYCWNYSRDNSLMFKSFIIGYASIFGPKCYLPNWSSFYIDVIYPFSKWKKNSNLDFRFDEKNWNKDFLNSIKTNSADFKKFIKKKSRQSINIQLTHSKKHETFNIQLNGMKSQSTPNLRELYFHLKQTSDVVHHRSKNMNKKKRKLVNVKALKIPSKSELLDKASSKHVHVHSHQNSKHHNIHHNLLTNSLSSKTIDPQYLNTKYGHSNSDSQVVLFGTHSNMSSCEKLPTANHYSYPEKKLVHSHNCHCTLIHSNSENCPRSNFIPNSEGSISNGHSNLLISQAELQNMHLNKKHKNRRYSNDTHNHLTSGFHSNKIEVNPRLDTALSSCDDSKLDKKRTQCNIF